LYTAALKQQFYCTTVAVCGGRESNATGSAEFIQQFPLNKQSVL